MHLACPRPPLEPQSFDLLLLQCYCIPGTVLFQTDCLYSCPANHYVAGDGITCTACPTTPVTSFNPYPGTNTSCLCPAQYVWNATTLSCQACGTAAVTVQYGNTLNVQCACPVNFYGSPVPLGTCTACPTSTTAPTWVSLRPGEANAGWLAHVRACAWPCLIPSGS
jgi:hypothetical protein